ncbi:MAG: F0F1 ATP synthase subunit alpha, partial [Oscillospiraceae bacterium]
ISITDGQIFLETELFNSGIRPAVNPGISVSRVGGTAQIKAMKKVAGQLKLLYSQYIELKSFSQFGSDLVQDTKDRLDQGARIVEVLKQSKSKPVPVAKQVIIIFAVTKNYLKDVAIEDIRDFEAGLLEYIETEKPQILDSINETKDLTAENTEAIIEAINTYKTKFIPKK